MVLIAGGGVTKAEGIALNCGKKKEFRVRTLGLNPAIISEEEFHETQYINAYAKQKSRRIFIFFILP
jgi:hypothetical protein